MQEGNTVHGGVTHENIQLEISNNDTLSPNNDAVSKSLKRKNKKLCYLVALLVIAVIALTIAVIVVASTSGDASTPPSTSTTITGSSTTTSTTTTSAPTTATSTPAPVFTEEEKSRIDCYPEALENPDQFAVNEAQCIARGCEFDAAARSGTPKCYVSSDSGIGVGYTQTVDKDDDTGMVIRLSPRAGSRRRRQASGNVVFEVNYYGENVLGFKLYLEGENSYRVPSDIVPLGLPTPGSSHTRQNRYKVILNDTNGVHSFKVIRQSNSEVLWDTSVGGLYLEDQFLTISTRLPSNNIYGFGENSHLSFRQDLDFRTWGLFARDELVSTSSQNHYSVHPFYTCLEQSGHSHGVLLLNSNAMDYSFTPLPMLTYRTTGGILDFYMFLGPTPENVVQQYTEVIGRPYMPPYWSLGFHLCRYGYNNLKNLTAAVDRTLAIDFPLDVQYADIDTYDVRKVFTIDQTNFAGLETYFDKIRKQGIRTITILDPALITNETDYEPHQRMLADDAYVKWPSVNAMPPEDFAETNSTTMLGYVWPMGKVAFPDFFSNRTKQIWESLIIDLRARLPFDGLWIDMNEPANFGTNEEKPWNWPDDALPYWSLKCPTGLLDDPPYPTMAIGRYSSSSRLSEKTLCMIARHDEQYDHYDVHNLYGTVQILPTLRALRNVSGERGLVLGRSTFVGAGRHVGHWLGDNFATWESMRMSIVGILEFNLFGIPYIGADICGFFGDTNLNLCKRWLQLGAFYTYSRSHNHEDSTVENDPGSFAFDEEFVRVTRDAYRIRYNLLPYLYTLFHKAHTRGDTVIRPLFHEFPSDATAAGIDRQFLWGSSLLISPILEDDSVTTMSFYLPQARWYNYHTGKAEYSFPDGGAYVYIQVHSDTQIPLHVKGGTIIPIQDYANNTQYSRENQFHLLAYLDDEDRNGGKAKGELFWDDGISIDTYENANYYFARYECRDQTLKVSVLHNQGVSVAGLSVQDISIHGVSSRPAVIIIGAIGQQIEHYDFDYDQNIQKLTIKNLYLPLEVPVGVEIAIDWGSERAISDEDKEKIECLPDSWRPVSACDQRTCTHTPTAPPDGVPRCYVDVDNFGYKFVNSTPAADGELVRLGRIPSSTMFGGDYDDVSMKITYMSDHVLRIKIYPTDVQRFEVPMELGTPSGTTGDRDYVVELDTDDVFSFKIKRNSTGTIIWDTSIGGLAVAEQFLQIVSRLPSMDVYGIGENEHHSFRHDFSFKTWPLFSRDQPPSDMANLYGVHPYYTCIEDATGYSHGVLLLNSNAMEISLQPSPQINYRTIGGVLDFYYVFGDNPEMVTQRYTELIGRPYFPPYWSLGFQLSRYGYNNIDNMKAAVDRTIAAKIPFDVQYGDIDHFDRNRDFTYDDVNFPDLPAYFQSLRDSGMKTIIILDPALVGVDPSYDPFTTGAAADVFIKWPAEENPQYDRFNNTYMHGYVWPDGEAVFPDFFLNSTHAWWKEWIVKWYEEGVPFDGLWIDMNEPANFDTNNDKPWNWPEGKEAWNLICPTSAWDDPPYKPNTVWGPRLSDKTICMVGTQANGLYRQYDTHSLYGWSQAQPTLGGLREAMPGRRGIIVSRSTFTGSGTNTGHWLGDNASYWPHLYYSIIGMLEFNLFGIPYIGADICGYFNDVTDEMCERWMQLGAFYTFSRNHNGFNYRDQDPGYLGDEVATSSRQALETRYTLLPYLYTLHYRAHVDGNTVIRPLHHEFYHDQNTLSIDRQFLWGPALLISPVLDEGEVSVDIYLPSEALWYDYYTGSPVLRSGHQTWEAPLDYIPLHIRGGFVIPTQQHANTTHFSRQKPLGLIVSPDVSQYAQGELFWDDGDSIDTVEYGNYSMYQFEVNQSRLNVTGLRRVDFALRMGEIRWFGVTLTPDTIGVRDAEGNRNHTDFRHNSATQELFMYNLDISMDDDWYIWF